MSSPAEAPAAVVRYAEALNLGMADALEEDETVVLLGIDVGAGGGIFTVTRGLFERFGPERVIDTPISEMGYVGAAVGAAMTGLRPIVEIMFMDFIGVCLDPILNQAAATYGISAAEMGRASVIGQPVHLHSPLVPSTYLLVGLVQVELGDHQRFTIRWSIITSFVLLLIGLVIGVIPFAGRA